MTSTTFVANQTLIQADWLNDVNAGTYTQIPQLASQLVTKIQPASSITSLRAVDKTKNSTILCTGYYTTGDGGGGIYVYDSTDTTSTDNGGTIIVATDGGRWKLQYKGSLSVCQFGVRVDGTNGPSNDTALASIETFLRAQTNPPKIYFPSGICLYSTSPNWAINNVSIQAQGDVHLRYTGTGIAVNIDGGASGAVTVLNPNFGGEGGGRFIVESNAAAGSAIYCRSFFGGYVSASVRSGGAAAAGLLTSNVVLVQFDVDVRPYITGWYNSAKPLVGYSLDKRGAGEQTSYCTFKNPTAAACSIGFYLGGTLGNVFICGDAEYNTDTGLSMSIEALNNKFFGTNFEVNTNADINCGGKYNEFHGCDTNNNVTFAGTSVGNELVGGNHDAVSVLASATANLLSGVKYNRSLGAATLNDSGTRTRFRDCINLATNAVHNVKPTNASITVTASPFVYTNTSGNEETLFITGGTIGNLSFYRNNVVMAAYSVGQVLTLSPTDYISISYSVAPTVNKISR